MVPANVGTGSRDFVGAERGTMHVVRAGLVWRTHTDDCLAADQCRLAHFGAGGQQRTFDGFGVVAVHIGDDLPAIGLKAFRRVVGEPALDVAVDRNPVVVVKRDQFAEAERAGQRAGFMRDAFHQAAVAKEHVGRVIDDLMVRLVELGRQHLFGNSEADGVGDALTERAGGRLDAGCVADFRVAGGTRAELAEILQIVDRQVVAGQVQQRVDQHRAMAVGKHETVAVRPFRVGRVVPQVAAPQHFGDFGHAHRRAGVAGVCFLHGVHGQCANRAGERGEGDAGAAAGGRGHDGLPIC